MTFRNTLSTLLLLLVISPLFSQKMEVIRTKSVDRATPVTNIFIDASNKIWVGNLTGLHRVFSPEEGSQQDVAASDWSLLQTHDGNFDLRVPLADLILQMGDKGQAIKSKNDRITSATYHESKDILWVGTRKSGLFEFKTKPSLRLVKRHHSGNTKLPSNQINTMLLDTRGQLWVGTYGGAFVRKDGKWSVEEKGFSFSAFAQNGTAVWAMGDNLLWKVDSRGRWEPKDIDTDLMEGDVADIAFDQGGKLWVVSEIVARFDPGTEEATVFGPAIGFTSQDVYCIAVDQNNGVWIGTNDKGLYLVQKAASLYVSAVVSQKLECDQPLNIAAVKLKVEGGVPPYSFAWKHGPTTKDINNLEPGKYEVTVRDSRGGSGQTEAYIDDPSITIELNKIKDVTLDEPTLGSAEVVLKGSPAGYKFKWSNGETRRVADQLPAGKHTVSVTDNFGCEGTMDIEITEEKADLSVSLKQVKGIDCPGDKTGSIEAKAVGGQAPYEYKWNIGLLKGPLLEGVSANTYKLEVKDAAGAITTAEITLEDPPAIEAKVVDVSPASTGNEDGKATVKVSGGHSDVYKYIWSSGETGRTATKLGPSDHSVTVTDEGGCEAVALMKITEDIQQLEVSISQKEALKCANDKGAALEASVNGGKGPFRFQWSGGEDSAAPTGLASGEYSLTVTDAVGTTVTKSFSIKEPKALSVTASIKSPASTNQSDGKATAKASGGTGKYTWEWSNGETSDNAQKLGAGSHSVTVTDENGCTAIATVDVKENILELNVELTLTNFIKCAGSEDAALQAEVSGGKAPFSYSWSDADLSGESPNGLASGDYKVTVTDAVGTTAMGSFKVSEPKTVEVTIKVDAPASTGNVDGKATATASGGTGKFTYAWSSGETSKTASKLAPGEHSVTVTDEAGCTGVATVNISENVLAINATMQLTTPIQCAGDKTAAISIKLNGGKAPFQYKWSDAVLSGENASGLSAGQYAVTVTDATGQTANASLSIPEPKAMEVSMVKNRPSTTEESKNGQASLRVTGGTPMSGGDSNYTYLWDNGETAPIAKGLAGGDHEVTVTDGKACTVTHSFLTKVRIIPELSADNLRKGATIKLNNIYFQPDSTKMEASSIPTVDELYDFLLENTNIVIEVGGHTNGIPAHDYCDRLSKERAKSVAQYLVDKGIPAKQLRFKGYGKRDPVATNSTEEGRAKNQRVEIKVLEFID